MKLEQFTKEEIISAIKQMKSKIFNKRLERILNRNNYNKVLDEANNVFQQWLKAFQSGDIVNEEKLAKEYEDLCDKLDSVARGL